MNWINRFGDYIVAALVGVVVTAFVGAVAKWPRRRQVWIAITAAVMAVALFTSLVLVRVVEGHRLDKELPELSVFMEARTPGESFTPEIWVEPGSTVEYQLTIVNHGPGRADGLLVSVSLNDDQAVIPHTVQLFNFSNPDGKFLSVWGSEEPDPRGFGWWIDVGDYWPLANAFLRWKTRVVC